MTVLSTSATLLSRCSVDFPVQEYRRGGAADRDNGGLRAASAQGAHDVDQSGSSTLMMQFSLDNARRTPGFDRLSGSHRHFVDAVSAAMIFYHRSEITTPRNPGGLGPVCHLFH